MVTFVQMEMLHVKSPLVVYLKQILTLSILKIIYRKARLTRFSTNKAENKMFKRKQAFFSRKDRSHRPGLAQSVWHYPAQYPFDVDKLETNGLDG